MKRLMLLSAALIFSASMSMAAFSVPDLVAAYQAQGYTNIEVTTGLTQIKVEAIQGVTKVEVIYDAETGAILSQQTGLASQVDVGTGVIVTTQDSDFIDDNADTNADGDSADVSDNADTNDDGDSADVSDNADTNDDGDSADVSDSTDTNDDGDSADVSDSTDDNSGDNSDND